MHASILFSNRFFVINSCLLWLVNSTLPEKTSIGQPCSESSSEENSFHPQAIDSGITSAKGR
jgi:hypothetical protein